MENPFGITREEVLNLAAQKLANANADSEYIEGTARTLIEARVKEAMRGAQAAIDRFLSAELEKIVSAEIVPRDIWGDKTGEPTTIRNMLAARAKTFWLEKVDKEGNPTNSYGAIPRHQQMFGSIVQKEFAEAIKQDVVNIVGALKDALIDQCNATVREKIDELIRVKTRK